MHKRTLRTRMAVWFTLSVLVVTVLFFSALYLITQERLIAMLRDDLTLVTEQLTSQVESENGRLIFEDETPVKAGIMYYIMEENGSELASHGEDIALFDAEPVREGAFTLARLDGTEWLLLDAKPMTLSGERIRIRAVASCAQIEQTLGIFRVIFLLGVPVMTALAGMIGFQIAKRSLRPIHRIIACANEIAEGDLTRRVPEEPSADELGELTRTLNRMLASLEDSLQRERRFTSDASHELRTPVAVIRAYAESLQTSTALSVEEKEKAETILKECGRMQRMIEQMLTLTRGQEGRYPVSMEHISLNDVMDGVEMVLSPLAEQRGITLHFHADAPIELVADQSLITRLLLNLTENAIKYGKDGGDVWVNATAADGHAVLTVADNGTGISAEQLPHIFERFFRADTARDRTGTGLGLSIVQWIATLHKGSIQAESDLGKGARFVVTLPFKQ